MFGSWIVVVKTVKNFLQTGLYQSKDLWKLAIVFYFWKQYQVSKCSFWMNSSIYSLSLSHSLAETNEKLELIINLYLTYVFFCRDKLGWFSKILSGNWDIWDTHKGRPVWLFPWQHHIPLHYRLYKYNHPLGHGPRCGALILVPGENICIKTKYFIILYFLVIRKCINNLLNRLMFCSIEMETLKLMEKYLYLFLIWGRNREEKNPLQ